MFGEPRNFLGPVRTIDGQHFQLRSESLSFAGPVGEERSRANNQGRSATTIQEEEGKHLHGFAEAHFVSQNSAEILRGERGEPGDTSELIIAQLRSERS